MREHLSTALRTPRSILTSRPVSRALPKSCRSENIKRSGIVVLKKAYRLKGLLKLPIKALGLIKTRKLFGRPSCANS